MRKGKKRDMRPVAFVAACTVVLAALIIFFGSGFKSSDTLDAPIHRHFQLDIFLGGEKLLIPAGVGIETGNVTDFDVSGIGVSPMHTHETDNTVHMEQVSPSDRTMRLGYFFGVWNKTFDADCIIDRCSSGGNVVKMFVNGRPSYEFGDYMPRDGDVVEIFYEKMDSA